MKTLEKVEHKIYATDHNGIAQMVCRTNCIGEALDAYTFHVEHGINTAANDARVSWHKQTFTVNKYNAVLSSKTDLFAQWELENA